ncbi:MAG TPA: hypothetical protein VGC22_00770 [Chitinophaga sp.]
MKLTKLLSLALLLAVGTSFSVAAQDTTKHTKGHWEKSDTTVRKTKTHMHKKMTRDSTMQKP